MASGPFAGLNLPVPGRESPPAPFDVACFCGTRLAGMRQSRHQVATCSKCGAARFILPVSPLPDLSIDRTGVAGSDRRRRSRWLAGAVLFGLVAIGSAILLTRTPERNVPSIEAPPTQEQLERQVQDASAALADGAYPRAERGFESALEIQRRLGNQSSIEQRRLNRLHRQASLLAYLLAETPAAFLRHSIGLPEADWQEFFQQRYAGRAIVLEDTISRNAAGQYQYGFRIVVLNNEARIDLAQLRVLRDLPLFQPQRMLIGMRLAGTRREPAGGWTILLDPDSGVLFTDLEMLAGLSIPVDAEVRDVLKRQQAWLEPTPQ